MNQIYQGMNGLIAVILVLLIISYWFIRNCSRNNLEETRRGKGHSLMEILIREQEKNRRLTRRVENLEEEMALLKLELNQGRKGENEVTDHQAIPFKNSLQYRSFMQKNQEIVLMLQDGHAVEQTARMTNRSVREIKMVQTLLNQRNTS